MKTLRKALAVLFSLIILIAIVSCKTGTIVYGDPTSSDVAVIFYPAAGSIPMPMKTSAAVLRKMVFP